MPMSSIECSLLCYVRTQYIYYLKICMADDMAAEYTHMVNVKIF